MKKTIFKGFTHFMHALRFGPMYVWLVRGLVWTKVDREGDASELI